MPTQLLLESLTIFEGGAAIDQQPCKFQLYQLTDLMVLLDLCPREGCQRLEEIPQLFSNYPQDPFRCMTHRQSTNHSAFVDQSSSTGERNVSRLGIEPMHTTDSHSTLWSRQASVSILATLGDAF